MNTALRQPLTNAQLEILGLFSENLSEDELKDLRQWLLQFRYQRLQANLDKLAREQNWTEKTFEDWSKKDVRKPYKAQQEYLQKIANEGSD